MLLNLSNHPSNAWPQTQMQAALKLYGTVKDLPFPAIDPQWDTDQVMQLAEDYVIKIQKVNPTAVHLMGELSFTFRLVTKLKAIGITCIASTSNRIAIEKNGIKTSVFEFVRFRDY